MPTPHHPAPDNAAALAFARDAARLAANTRCSNVIVLDVRHVSPITDFFVIATGTSPRQMRTVCDDIEELALPRNYKPLSRCGYGLDQWVLLDYVDVIIHLFSDTARQYYDLENLWGDAKRIDWHDTQPPSSKSAQT